jgi:hypothetical protein
MAGPGRELASNTLAIQQILDPEFYKSRGQAGDALTSLFGSLDDPTTGLSGAEREEVTRTLARDNASRGNLDATQNSTVEAAMQMGSAGQARKSQKQAAIGQAVQAAAGAMPAFRTGVDALQLTTGRPSTPNVGLGQFGGVQQVGNNTMQLGSQLMQPTGTFAGNNQQNQATKKDIFDKTSQIMGSIPSVSCCWTFREFTDKFEGHAVPRPAHWGGYLIRANYYEFWQGRPNRLHDRLSYKLVDGVWTIGRMAP